MADVTCVRCGETRAGLAFAPFNNELGKQLHQQVCQQCWAAWLQRQTALINHNGLNLRDPEARAFLAEQTREYFFGSGDTEHVDTSKQGTISW
jgi:Fe-S cluster biosynthesis and repair protein YggX